MMDDPLIGGAAGILRRSFRPVMAALVVASSSAMAVASDASPLLPPNCAGDLTVVSCTFHYDGTTGDDGSPQSFTVPVGVGRLVVEAWGAEGGNATTADSTFSQPALGGLGGYTRATVAVTAGESVTVFVGGQPTGTSGGYNGGGAAGPGSSGDVAEAGGGATDVRLGGDDPTDRVVVAGGGGGAADDADLDHGDALGGAGGGTPGATSFWCPGGGFVATCGAGGTVTAGGAAGTPAAGCASPGTLGQGGSGCGGGGGGGYYGGGGGGLNAGSGPGSPAIAGPGGGGSGYVAPSATAGSTAVGVQYGNGLVRISYTTARSFPGLRWSTPHRVVFTPGGISAVSCAAPTFCVAVDGAGRVTTYDGRWSKPEALTDGTLSAVSCPSRSFCAAVGSIDASDTSEPVVAVDRHGTWSTATGPVAGAQEVLTGVSCVSGTFCVAAGTYLQSGAPGTTAFVQTFDGHSWAVVDNTVDLSGYASGDSMAAVSCSSITFCAAAGIAGDRSDIGGLVDVDERGTWTGTQISDDRTVSFEEQGGLDAISCPAVHACLAAGPSGYVFTYDGTGWTQDIGDPQAPVTAVSCPDSSTCLAADGAGSVLTEQGGNWEVARSVDPGHAMSSLSCPTARFCVGVDSGGRIVVGHA